MRALKTGLMLLLWVVALTARAELVFPALTGRVVDNAQMIEPSVRQQPVSYTHLTLPTTPYV